MKLSLFSYLLIFLLREGSGIKVVTIDSVGALANDSSSAAATKNSQVISSALQNATSGSAVLVPRYSRYYIYSVSASGLQNVQFWVEGHLITEAEGGHPFSISIFCFSFSTFLFLLLKSVVK